MHALTSLSLAEFKEVVGLLANCNVSILCNTKTWQTDFCKYWENSQQISITDG